MDCESSRCGSAEMNQPVSRKMWILSLASLSGLRIQHCSGLWCTSQTRLGSGIAVAVASAVAPIRPLAWKHPLAGPVALKTKNKTLEIVIIYLSFQSILFLEPTSTIPSQHTQRSLAVFSLGTSG